MSDAQERIITFGMLTDKEQDALRSSDDAYREQRLHDLGIVTESKTPLATIARIAELEEHLQSVLDRETSIIRYYDAKIDEAYAKLVDAMEALQFYRSAVNLRVDCEITHAMQEAHIHAEAFIAKIKGE